MPIDRTRRCACHDEPMYRGVSNGRLSWTCYRLVRRQWQGRNDRYRRTAKGRLAHARSTQDANARKVRIGHTYVGLMETPEQAQRIQAHVTRRLRDFQETHRASLTR